MCHFIHGAHIYSVVRIFATERNERVVSYFNKIYSSSSPYHVCSFRFELTSLFSLSLASCISHTPPPSLRLLQHDIILSLYSIYHRLRLSHSQKQPSRERARPVCRMEFTHIDILRWHILNANFSWNMSHNMSTNKFSN